MDEDSRTLFVGGVLPEVTEDLLYELFLQAGPLERVNIPKDKDGSQKKFGFVVFKHESSVPYSIELFRGTKVFGRELMLKRRNANPSESPAQQRPSERPTGAFSQSAMQPESRSSVDYGFSGPPTPLMGRMHGGVGAVYAASSYHMQVSPGNMGYEEKNIAYDSRGGARYERNSYEQSYSHSAENNHIRFSGNGGYENRGSSYEDMSQYGQRSSGRPYESPQSRNDRFGSGQGRFPNYDQRNSDYDPRGYGNSGQGHNSSSYDGNRDRSYESGGRDRYESGNYDMDRQNNRGGEAYSRSSREGGGENSHRRW